MIGEKWGGVEERHSGGLPGIGAHSPEQARQRARDRVYCRHMTRNTTRSTTSPTSPTTRQCRAHDEDDPVKGRICGAAVPCQAHPRGWRGTRLRSTARLRRPVLVTLSEEGAAALRRLARARGRGMGRVVEELVLREAGEG